MSQTKTPNMTPTPIVGKVKTKPTQELDNPGMVFIGMTLDMSWRLALSVLLPLLGGYAVDKKLKTIPIFTIIGLIVAGLSVYIVIKRTLSQVNQRYEKSNNK